MNPTRDLRASCEAFSAVVSALGDEGSRRATGCAGWTVRDLVHHCLSDARRGLVALRTPASGPADRDAVAYWRGRRPGTADAADERRRTRVCASLFPDFRPLRELYLETAAATVAATVAAGPGRPVSTQGHVMTAGDLVTTPAGEATVHHLDLVAGLSGAPGPPAAGLAAVRATPDGLLGGPVPLEWGDERYARAATGRARLTEGERRLLGPDADRFPLFG